MLSEGSSTVSVLLLGMVFAHQATEPKRGQEYRDRVRCEAVQGLGYTVYTLDDKHLGDGIREHCNANFGDVRRMMRSIREKWNGSVRFDEIILDYFFSPIGWARERWTERFFTDALPAFAVQGLLKENGKIWLPNMACIEEEISKAFSILSSYYNIELPSNFTTNPLYRGTELVEKELLSCPDALTNETQLRPLLGFSSTPFYCLTVKSRQKDPSTPSKIKKNSRKIVSEIIDGTDSNTSTPKKRKTRL